MFIHNPSTAGKIPHSTMETGCQTKLLLHEQICVVTVTETSAASGSSPAPLPSWNSSRVSCSRGSWMRIWSRVVTEWVYFTGVILKLPSEVFTLHFFGVDDYSPLLSASSYSLLSSSSIRSLIFTSRYPTNRADLEGAFGFCISEGSRLCPMYP